MADKTDVKPADDATDATKSISEQAAVTEAPEGASEGVRARKAFMLRHFIPAADWITKNVVLPGKGTRVTLGRVYGAITGWEEKNNTLNDGKVISSICLKGSIMTESYLTGEIGASTSAYLPEVYAEKVKALFLSDANIRVVELDCDVGVEATGKSIPYEWVIIAFREGEEMDVLKRIRTSRGRPASAPPLPAPVAPAALTDQTKAA